MRMEKRTFRIGQLAKQLNIQRFVIRFWEKEFNIKSSRPQGKQRFYTQDDLELFATIKELLYQKGYTIAGARQALAIKNKEKSTGSEIIASTKIVTKKEIYAVDPDLQQKLIDLREQLQKLYTIL